MREEQDRMGEWGEEARPQDPNITCPFITSEAVHDSPAQVQHPVDQPVTLGIFI